MMEFLLQKMHDASDFFYRNVKNELELQEQLNKEKVG
jgi:hypothetical protein